MATISNPNDPNRNKSGAVNLTTSNATPASEQQQAPASQAAASGQYPTLQKYLGANQQAGQRLGEQVGRNVTAQSQAAQKTASRETSEAGAANTAYRGLVDQAKQFTSRLQTPVTVQPANPMTTTQTSVENISADDYKKGPATISSAGDVKKQPVAPMPKDLSGGLYDVSKYSTNVAGLEEARKIAADQEQLNQLRGLAAGTTFNEQKKVGDKEVAEALNATAKEKEKQQELQRNVSTEQGRTNLLSQLFGNQPGYKSGVRQLDQAFLQQDKSNQLGNISNQLKQNVSGINERAKQSQQASDLLKQLITQGGEASTGLQSATAAVNQAYRSDLQNRIEQVNKAKADRVNYLNQQLDSMKNSGQITADVASAFGLTPEVLQGLVTDTRALNPYANDVTGTTGVRLFDTVKNLSNIGDIFSQDQGYVLGQQANSLADVVNTADIAALNDLAAIAGGQNELTQASQFTGQQTGASRLPELLQARNQRFQDESLGQRFQYDTGDLNFGDLGQASAGASTSLQDYLYGPGIYREVQSRGNLQNVGSASPQEILNQHFRAGELAERSAVANLQNNVNDYLNSIGYQNLLRILGDE